MRRSRGHIAIGGLNTITITATSTSFTNTGKYKLHNKQTSSTGSRYTYISSAQNGSRLATHHLRDASKRRLIDKSKKKDGSSHWPIDKLTHGQLASAAAAAAAAAAATHSAAVTAATIITAATTTTCHC